MDRLHAPKRIDPADQAARIQAKPAMDRRDPVAARRRWLWLALVVLSLGLASVRPEVAASRFDSQTRAALGQWVGHSLAPPSLAEVDAVLRAANPGLADEERHRIGAAILRSTVRYGLDADLILAVMLVESDARPDAQSAKGALGLMQVMPHMMVPLELAGNAMTIESNVEAGCFILADNIRRLGFERGISAYFWGNRVRNLRYLEKVLAERDRVRGLIAS